MPTISRIRFTNVVYETGAKRYQDEIFSFDGYNGIVLLENGGGKTVFVQTALQAVLPHAELADRKIANTLSLGAGPAHIAIEWILHERPRKYGLTAVTLFLDSQGHVDSYRYAYEYAERHEHSLESIPFVRRMQDGNLRPADKGEINEYYKGMTSRSMVAKRFETIRDYQAYLEDAFKIITTEWESIAHINCAEGDIDAFFKDGKSSVQLVEQLLIPTVERTIPGKGSADFADNFQKQREHFRQHKLLREKIEESKMVEKRVGQLSILFEESDLQKKSHMISKQKAKALFQNTERESALTRNGLEATENREVQYLIAQSELQRIESAWELAVLEKQITEANVRFIHADTAMHEGADALKNIRARITELSLAQRRQELQELQAELMLLTQQLEYLNKESDAGLLQETADEVGMRLNGAYSERFDALKQLVETHSTEKIREDNRLKELKTAVKLLNDKHQGILRAEESERRAVQVYTEDMEGIAGRIVPVYPQNSMDSMRHQWLNRAKEVEKGIRHNAEQLGTSRKLLKDLEDEARELRTVEIELSERIVREKAYQDEVDREEESVRESLGGIKGDWGTYPVFQKQGSLLNSLSDRMLKADRDIEKARQQERIATRWHDDYHGKTTFTADPGIEGILSRLGTQFSMLESGPSFLKACDVAWNPDAIRTELGFWAMTVVTSEAEINSVRDRLITLNEELSGPIYLLSDQQALQAIEKPEEWNLGDCLITPQLWADNLSSENFSIWTQLQLSKQQRLQEELKQLENNRNAIRSVQETLQNFLGKYPWETVEKKRMELGEQLSAQKDLEYRMTVNQDAIRKNRENVELTQNRAKEFEKEQQHLDGLLNQAERYRELERKLKESEKKRRDFRTAAEAIKNEYDQTERNADSAYDECQEIAEKLMQVKSDQDRLNQDPQWKQVRNMSKAPAQWHEVSSLKEEWQALQDSLNQRQAGRRQLENQLERTKETAFKRQGELSSGCADAGIEEETLEFPIDGEIQLQACNHKRKALEADAEPIGKLRDEVSGILKTLQGNREHAQKIHTEKWGACIEMPVEQNAAPEWIEKERQRLQWDKNETDTQKRELRSAEKLLLKLMKELEIKNEVHQFCSHLVEDTELEEAVLTDLPYKREWVVQKFIDALEKGKQAWDTSQEKLSEGKHQFRVFCEKNIADYKLRDRAVSGMESVRTMEELMAWRENITRTLLQVIKMAENDLIEHDKQLTTFVGHMHSHMSVVAEDLRRIPKSTRVKQGEQWKEIYSFHIPEWDENEGREKLRSHLDKLLDELDTPRFESDGSAAKDAEIRKHIERNLQTKQLMGILTNRKPYQIKCRKVSNDGHLSERYFAWEESNNWSGGEKWSKNMALFLGILNYVAEKRKLIEQQTKRHRSVILDNPFGKASSDHVLHPVFYIAEQLGFQIIALTAHDDGKFIRDYFPVVYGCRLKNLVGGESKAVVKEQHISQAWFQEHDPQALLRLGEQRQINMFDMQ